MLEVVATTPSSPLGACRLVTLDMAPRWQWGWIYVAGLRKKGAAEQLSFIRQPRGSLQAHAWLRRGSVCATKRIDKRFILQALGLKKAMLAELLNALRTPPQPQPLKVHHRTAMILIGFCASSLSAVILIAILREKHYLLLVATIFPLFVIWSASGRLLKRAMIGKSVTILRRPWWKSKLSHCQLYTPLA